MELKDIIITPIFLAVLFPFFLGFRSAQKDPFDRQLVSIGLTIKFLGALAIGLIYQFYYGGGDTFNFYKQSKIVWEATLENPMNYLKFAFSSGNFIAGLGQYISKLYWYSDPSSFFVIKVASFFGLFTLNAYLPISFCFALMSFSGSWTLYSVFKDRYPNLKKEAAIAAFLVPSCVIWGSGLFKDTLTFAAIGWVVYAFYWILIRKTLMKSAIIGGVIAIYVLVIVKVYILLSLVPCLLGWLVLENLQSIGSPVVRFIVSPLFFALGGVMAFLTLDQLAENNAKYDLENIALTSRTTAYDIAYWTGKGAGSTYILGDHDGTFTGILSLAPQAVVVTLFRPWLWEANNVLMLILALESVLILLLTMYILLKGRAMIKTFRQIRSDPFLVFCFVFSVVFAVGVGVSSFNFGSLARYKIPLLPFYVFGLLVLNAYLTRRDTDRI